jgi:uncharacterized protein
MSSLPVSAFLIGIWSTGHCLAMCGGLAMAAGQVNRRNLNNTPLQRGIELASWQFGRVASYMFIGALAGAFGAFFLSAAPVEAIRNVAFIIANLILIALGMHVARIWSGIVQLERIGQVIWKFIAPFATATLVPQTPKHRNSTKQILNALRTGAIWGWLPCGLVYSMLITASVSGGATNGALWMLFFGLGTIPALWLTSIASDQAAQYLRNIMVRRIAGLLIIAFGLWGLLRIAGVIKVDWLDAFCIGTGAL